jgi:gliding motility-associated-like protein
VDYCGNVYVGGKDSVYEFDSSLIRVNAVKVPDSVYAVIQGNNSDIIAGGANFIADLDFTNANTSSVSITTKGGGCSGCNNSATATLKLCGVPDTTTVTYLWSNGQTTRTATGLCAGSYTVVVSGCFQTSYTDSVTIKGGLSTTDSITGTSCTANTGTATVKSSTGVQPFTWKWSTGATTETITGLSAGTYTCIMSDNTGCTDTTAVTITSSGAPIITVTPTDDSICLGGSVPLLAKDGTSYTWLPVAGLSCTTCPNPTASPATTTTYTVTGDSNGCSNTATVTIVINPSPVVSINPSTFTICIGQNVVLAATGASTYTWTPPANLSCTICDSTTASPTSTTTYTVTGTNSHGCTSTATATIMFAQPGSISVSPPQTICTGASATLSASGSTGTFNWQPGNLSGSTITVSPSTSTIYTVTLTGSCSLVTDTVPVTVSPLPTPGFSTSLQEGCYPLCIQFRDMSTGNINQWNWVFGNGDSSNVQNPIYCYQNSGNFNVSITVTTKAGCSSTLKIADMIDVFGRPLAAFSESPQPTTITNPNIQFTNQTTDLYGIASWTWNFGDSSNTALSHIENPTHTYSDTGTYCATLIAINEHGCADTTTHCMIIESSFSLYIPSAFTPNSGGLNDVFMPVGKYIKSYQLYIFDRWGMQLANTTNKGWNGRVNNGSTICQEDSYVYLINVTDDQGNIHKYLGKVTLLK